MHCFMRLRDLHIKILRCDSFNRSDAFQNGDIFTTLFVIKDDFNQQLKLHFALNAAFFQKVEFSDTKIQSDSVEITVFVQ